MERFQSKLDREMKIKKIHDIVLQKHKDDILNKNQKVYERQKKREDQLNNLKQRRTLSLTNTEEHHKRKTAKMKNIKNSIDLEYDKDMGNLLTDIHCNCTLIIQSKRKINIISIASIESKIWLNRRTIR